MIGISYIPGCHGSLVGMATRVKLQYLLCLKSYLVHISQQGFLRQWASVAYLVAVVTRFPWQPE